ncbi:class II fumarate hydratase [Atopobiaceae bacterium LCP21S3_F7]
MEYRYEHDSMGEVRVPADALWGAQTQRSLENFPIGDQTMPKEIVRALALVKKAAAQANAELGVLDQTVASLIEEAADEVLAGEHDDALPLNVRQTRSGNQSNMNKNEVLAHIANAHAAERGIALERPVHPNDDVNRSQSSNDAFPCALSVAAALALVEEVIPPAQRLMGTFKRLEVENEGVVKSGRTHLQDAVPIAFSQEVFGWRGLVATPLDQMVKVLPFLYRLPLGATAVGTGLNAPEGFGDLAAEKLHELTDLPFRTDPNKFHALTSKDSVVFAHAAIKALACNLMKVANDVRWLASGPRCGLGEISIPANEPGSSIMPGKVNPTQCEALTMVAVEVMGNDAAIGFAASQGNFELNVFMPLIAYDYLESARLLGDAIASFDERCASGIVANREKMASNLHNSLMLVTCLNPYIGYERAAKVAHKAYEDGVSLREACCELGFLSEEEFDKVFKPEEMV